MTEAADVGNNFFLSKDSIGKPRAEQQVEYLKELNDGVKGRAVVSVCLSQDPKNRVPVTIPTHRFGFLRLLRAFSTHQTIR